MSSSYQFTFHNTVTAGPSPRAFLEYLTMLKTSRLAHASKTVARAQSQLAYFRHISPSLSQPRLPHSQSQVSRRIYSTGTAHLQDGSHKPTVKTERSRALAEDRTARLGNVGQLGRLLRVSSASDNNSISLEFEHDTISKVSPLLLRDACLCAQCVSESSGQKNFATCDIDVTPQLESSSVLGDGSLELVWAHDFMSGGSHTSLYPPHFLERYFVDQLLPELYTPKRYVWDRAFFEEDMETRAVNYDAWMTGGEAFVKSLLDLCQWGLVIIKGVPESKEAVEDIASKIGTLQSTFYGKTWDVISKPNAENVAYTNEFLCLHQDLMYHADIPHVQLLHCIKNDCQGGDSLFSDGFRAAVEIQHRHPGSYKMLMNQPVNYQYSRNGHFYRKSRRVIQKAPGNRERLPDAIHWSPPFQGPFAPLATPDSMRTWHKGAKAFKSSLEAPENMLQYRLQPGDCVLFDNWRILHGRTRFDTASGLRHLHGGYLSRQTLLSAVRREVEKGHIEPTRDLSARDAETEQAVIRYGKAAGGTVDQKTESTAGQGV